MGNDIVTPFTTTTVSDDLRANLMRAIRENMAVHAGRGSAAYVTEGILSKTDRFGCAPIQLNSDMVGLTFFTRPRLNMSTISLRQDPTLAMLATLDPQSFMFSIRCNLDSKWARSPVASSAAAQSPFFSDESAFNIPMGNLLQSISGYPDFTLEYETTESGYFSEDMTMVRGSDWGRRTYNLSCTFRDIQGGYLMAYFYYWLYAMALQMSGNIVPYPDDRAANRLNYTCSIYRFVLSPDLTTIVKWSKATGCFPTSLPIGDVFNFGVGDTYVHASQQFTIPFIANNVRYMDPRHLQAFNTLVTRYTSDMGSRQQLSLKASDNFKGVPYIDLVGGQNKIHFMGRSDEIGDPTVTALANAVTAIQNQTGVYS